MSKGLKLISKWDELRKQVHEYFGYKEDWVCLPMETHLGEHWMICGPENERSSVVNSKEEFTLSSISAGNSIYGSRIYTQRFLPKWVYRGEDLTMISVETGCDGNRILMIFENKLECKDDTLKNLYNECWGLL